MAAKAGDKLTVGQEKFVQKLIAGKSQREAYRLAFPSAVKWKDSSVDSKASALLAKVKVRQRYDTLLAKVQKKAEEECMVTAEEIIRELKKIGFADIKDYLSFKAGPKGTMIVDIKDSDDVDGAAIQEVSLNDKGTFSFKLYDKLSALEKLGKTIGMYTDRVESVNKNVNITVTDEEEARKILLEHGINPDDL